MSDTCCPIDPAGPSGPSGRSLPSSVKLLTRLGYNVESLRAPWPPGRPAHTCVPPDAQALKIPKTEDNFCIVSCVVEALNEEKTAFKITHMGQEWFLNTKVVMNEEDIKNIASIAVRFAPVGSTVNMQADTHGAGNVYVGLIMTFAGGSIPINMISGDIGCGLSIVPFVKSGAGGYGVHVKEEALGDAAAQKKFYSYALGIIRRTLKRGRAAEEGGYLSKYIRLALEFYGMKELPLWLDEMRDILDHVDIPFDTYKDSGEVYEGLTADQSSVLRYIGRFAQSLGSSGNHFMEVSRDEQGYLWAVVHSGSRGLGAKVYSVIAEACRIVNAAAGFSCELATGPLAVFYARIYDCLNKFAKLNRIMCAIAVLHDLGFETDAATLQAAMRESFVFKPAMEACGEDGEAMLSLMSGLTHNGIKAYINDVSKEVHYVLSKGAIAMTRRASASIVALRAGDGCYVWTLADQSCPWREVDIRVALSKGYTPVYVTDGVIYSGHGAGRSRSTNKTAAMTTFDDLGNFFRETDVVGNIAPGVLGDNPRIAYNDVATIVKHLPLDIACTKSRLRTRVAHKEGITYTAKHCDDCARYINKMWSTATDEEKLWYDINLCQKYLDDYKGKDAERNAILERIAKEYGLDLERSH